MDSAEVGRRASGGLAAFAPGDQPRARGRAAVSARLRDGASRVGRLEQQGSARCMLPATPGRLEAVLLNTAGGVTGGDLFAWGAEAEAGAFLTVSTQAAERAYRAQTGETGRVDAALRVGPGARLDWLPQETILFDGADLARRYEVDMAADGRLLMVEQVALGRLAMGETAPRARLRDVWRVRRDGRTIFADALRLDGEAPAAALDGPGCWAGARAAATVLYVAPDAEDRLAAARAALGDAGRALNGLDADRPAAPSGGASAWRGMLVARLLAPDACALRAALLPLIHALRDAAPPRVWRL